MSAHQLGNLIAGIGLMAAGGGLAYLAHVALTSIVLHARVRRAQALRAARRRALLLGAVVHRPPRRPS